MLISETTGDFELFAGVEHATEVGDHLAAYFEAARSLRGRRKAALHIDAKRCISATYCGPNGLKTFCRADS